MAERSPLILKNKVQRKIMLFFTENQGSIDTPRGISVWINEGLASVRKALEGLVEKGYLKAHRTTSTVGYSCALSKTELSRIASLLKKK